MFLLVKKSFPSILEIINNFETNIVINIVGFCKKVDIFKRGRNVTFTRVSQFLNHSFNYVLNSY